MIVESPRKAKKIRSFLGDGWEVTASYGHVRDLPTREMGVDLQTLRPTYVVPDDRSKKTVSRLRALARQASEIWLATDPDREGEAIAWHCAGLIRAKDPKRIVFHEITKSEIQKALTQSREIDMDLVRAQETRRILDRLVGYLVSPALNNKVGKRGLSAGRVQSVALRLVVARERAITHFISETHYGVRAHMPCPCDTDSDAGEQKTWPADWDTSPHLGKNETLFKDKTYAAEVALLRDFEVTDVQKKQGLRKPQPPFTTPSMQKVANARLKASAKQTMDAAQHLFEEGLISYHRTDSTTLSEECINACRDWLQAHGYGPHIAKTPHTWKSKASAQEAHEAIRPADITIEDAGSGDPVIDGLYKLIRQRTLASQMAHAVYDVTHVVLRSVTGVSESNDSPEAFIAKGRIMRAPGWTALTQGHDPEANDDDDRALPDVAIGVRITATAAEVLEKQTKPPPRYTEGTLTEKMDNVGIGRPATYASIISTLKKREYLFDKKNKLYATDLGDGIISLLVDRFQFAEVEFTAHIEQRLDLIAHGEDTYAAVTRNLLDELGRELKKFESVHVNNIGKFAQAQTSVRIEEPDTPIPCPSCSSNLRRVHGAKGVFWGCGNRDCSAVMNDADGAPDIETYKTRKRIEANAQTCPKCKKGKLLPRNGSKGQFWGCTGYPKCKVAMDDAGGEPNIRRWLEHQKKLAEMPTCPVCSKNKLHQRTGGKGLFWGCGGFPQCRATFEDNKGKPRVTAERVAELKSESKPASKGGGTKRKGVKTARRG